MNNLLKILPVIFILTACSNNGNESYMTAERAIWYFNAIEEICNRDNGELWGDNLYGPIMFVDPATRFIIANTSDGEGLLRFRDSVYTGFYPKEKLINVVPLEYGTTTYAMVPLPSNEDEMRIKSRALHALVHRLQRERGLEPPGYDNRHMNDENARMWLKLEWRALATAIRASDEQREIALRDALIFRGARHEAFPSSVTDEIRFENFEGMTLYSYQLLLNERDEDLKRKLLELLNSYYRFPSFINSFGFIHGALYTYLLTEKGFELSSVRDDSVDLGTIAASLYHISLPEMSRDVAGSIAINYNIDRIMEEEAVRDRRRREDIKKELTPFTERPVVFFDLESPSFGFEPDDSNTLDTLGTIYHSLRVSDNWGKLTVNNGGCLVLHNMKEMRVPAKGIKVRKNQVSGDGWNLHLNDRWDIVKENNDFFVKMVIP